MRLAPKAGPGGDAPTARVEPTLEDEVDLRALERVLDAIAHEEARFTERFYEIFFLRRPDARELFGRHSLSEQEEMMRETLRSLAAWYEGEAWLEGNLQALGQSHVEYGVTDDMYESFLGVMRDTAKEILGASLGADEENALLRATSAVCELMIPNA